MTKILFLKSHNKGYTKKDGTVVAPFEDKRVAKPKQGSFFDNYAGYKKPAANPKITAPQLGLPSSTKHPAFDDEAPAFGGSLFGFWGGGFKPQKSYPNAVDHPAKSDNGKTVRINEPTEATAPETWEDSGALAVFVPGGDVPAELHGVPLSPWEDHPKADEDWDYVEGQRDDLEEPPMHLPIGKKAASGVVIEEPDGRIWLVSPTNQFGGYDTTYPKGKAEEDLSLQANAIKEAFEESGLKVEITGLLGDFERTTSVTRLYTARRVGGSPAAVGWETQAVKLVPREMLGEVAGHHNDAVINDLLKQ